MLVRFAESDKVLMAKVRPAICSSGFFFAEREIETQLEHIVYYQFGHPNSRRRVKQMQEGDLLAI